MKMNKLIKAEIDFYEILVENLKTGIDYYNKDNKDFGKAYINITIKSLETVIERLTKDLEK